MIFRGPPNGVLRHLGVPGNPGGMNLFRRVFGYLAMRYQLSVVCGSINAS